MNLEVIKKNKVGMILQFAIPSIISMLLTSLITVADGFFVGNYVGKEGIAAINLGMPIVYLYLALGLMLAVGGSAIAGMALGAEEHTKCNAVFNQTILTTVLVTAFISVIVLFCLRPMLAVVHAQGLVAEYFMQYYLIMIIELPLMVISSAMGMFIRGEGNPQFFMVVNIVNVVLNIVLDYLFARWLHLGVTGIAAASLISAIVSIVWLVYFFMKKSKVYKLGRFTFSKKVLQSTIFNGFSEFIGEMSMCISMFAYNLVIMKNIGVDGVTAFTIVGYVSYMFSMIIIGFGQGASPLMSFTYGAKEWELTRGIRRKTNQFVFGAGVIVIVIMLALSDWYSGLFVHNTAIEAMVHTGIMIFMISFLFTGINTITSFYFTSIGKAKESAIISSSRGFVILLICIFTLPVFFGMNGVWMVAPITEGITILLSVWFIFREKANKTAVNTDSRKSETD